MPDEPELPEAVDLVAFLTARWDEEEAVAKSWPDDISPTAPDGRPWRDSSGHYIYAPRTHVLADLAAKRRILSDFVRTASPYGSADQQITHEVLEEVLVNLAQPYRTHPDFDPAWEV